MAIIETSRSVPLGAVSTFRIVTLIDTAVNNVMSAYRAHQTQKSLQSLSNAQLDDIGVERGTIERVARRASQH